MRPARGFGRIDATASLKIREVVDKAFDRTDEFDAPHGELRVRAFECDVMPHGLKPAGEFRLPMAQGSPVNDNANSHAIEILAGAFTFFAGSPPT